MIGNDIVDLKLAAVQSDWRRKGWLDKVFEISEQKRILEARDANLMVWKLWSMKEAAYKAHQRSFSLFPKYNPKDFVCRDTSVYIENSKYNTISKCTVTYTYTIAYNAAANTNFVSRVYNNGYHHYKNNLLHYIADIADVHPQDVKLHKNNKGIPFVHILDKSTEIPLSLTSHGLFSAFAIVL